MFGSVKPETSRLLDAKEKLFDSRMDAGRRASAIRYGEFPEATGGDAGV